jgi:hypothetical protein
VRRKSSQTAHAFMVFNNGVRIYALSRNAFLNFLYIKPCDSRFSIFPDRHKILSSVPLVRGSCEQRSHPLFMDAAYTAGRS